MASFSCSCSLSLCLGSSSSFSSELAPKFMQMSNKPVNSLQQFPSLSDAPARSHLTYEVLNIVPQNAATYRLNPIWASESPCGLRIQLLHVRKTFSTICEFNLLFVWCFFLFCLLIFFFSVHFVLIYFLAVCCVFVNWCKYCFGTRNVRSSGSTRTDSNFTYCTIRLDELDTCQT